MLPVRVLKTLTETNTTGGRGTVLMPTFEQPWTITFDIPQEVIDKTPNDDLKVMMGRFIAQGAHTEFTKIIDEWIAEHKKKAEPITQPDLNVFSGVLGGIANG